MHFNFLKFMTALLVGFNLKLQLMSYGCKCSDIGFHNCTVMKQLIRNSSGFMERGERSEPEEKL